MLSGMLLWFQRLQLWDLLGRCSCSFPRYISLCLLLPFRFCLPASISLCFMFQWCRSFQNRPRCFKSLCMFCFLSLECLYSVLPLGKLLLILQNSAQTALPPRSSWASFPGEFITLFSTWSHLSSYSRWWTPWEQLGLSYLWVQTHSTVRGTQ